MAQLSFADVRLNYDPSAPQQRFLEAGLEAAFASPVAQLPASAWFEYRRGISAYLSLVTGPIAPFNDKASDMARYFHSPGLYFSCQIRSAKARQRSTWQSRTPIRVSSLDGSRQCAIPTEQRKT